MTPTLFDTAIQLITSARRILLSTHARPDGDAMGSINALQQAIDQAAHAAGRICQTQMLVLHEIGENYQFLLTPDAWITQENYPEEEIQAGSLDEFDLIIVADTRAVRQLPVLGDYLLERKKRAATSGLNTLVIDHHLTGDEIATCQIVDTSAGAAGEIVFKLIEQAGWPLTPQAAEALFVAISTDSGWFRFENTTAQTLAQAARLVALGAQPSRLYDKLFLQHPHGRVKLLGKALDTLELHDEGRLAVMQITQAMLDECQATRPMIENIVNEPMQIDTVVGSLLLVELPDAMTRCSLRSKHTLDCSALTGRHGGGGHARAAGLTLHLPLAQAKALLLNDLSPCFPSG